METLTQERSTRRKGTFIRVFILWSLVALAISGGDFLHYLRDRREIRQIFTAMNVNFEDRSDLARDVAIKVRNRLKTASQGRYYDIKNRPVLRHTAVQTWSSCEGQCGEGSRLIVNLLQCAGVPATRVNLANSTPAFYHTAVAYQYEGQWWLLDSINSTEEFFQWSTMNTQPLSALVEVKMDSGGALLISPNNPFFSRYSFAPWARLFGTKVEINQFAPFPQWLVTVLENPPLFLMLVKLALFGTISVFSVLATWLGRKLLKRFRRSSEA